MSLTKPFMSAPFMVIAMTALFLSVMAAPVMADDRPEAQETEAQQAEAEQDASTDQGERRTDDDVIDTAVEFHEAHEHPEHEGDGHLPGSVENVELIGQANIRGGAEGRVADVAAFGDYAYLTVRDPVNCTGEEAAGVAVFDISDPRSPTQVGFIVATAGSQPGEGADVLNMDTDAFTGQVLVFNNELCDEEAAQEAGGSGGVTLVDVTDPLNPDYLVTNFGDPDVLAEEEGFGPGFFNDIHSAFAWQDGQRAFTVLVDNFESGGTDVDIADITDPRNPTIVSEFSLNPGEGGLTEEGVLQQDEGTPLGEASFIHDVTVKEVDGQHLMLISYWDGGWVQVNVDDPANPLYVSDFDYPVVDAETGLTPSEGNAHQAEYSFDNEFIVGTDEDFAPYRSLFEITSGDNAGEFPAGEFGFSVQIADLYEDDQVNGPTIYGGLGCPGDDEEIPDASTLEAGEGEETIVVLLRGTCFFSEKIEAGQDAGYDHVVIANSHAGADFGESPDSPLCGSQGHEFTPTRSATCIGHRAFHLLFNTEPQYGEGVADEPEIGTVGESVTFTAVFDGWGYVRLLDRETMQQIDTYAIDEALDPAFASGFGDLSVHEVATDPSMNLAYFSYYAGGLRVAEFGEGGIHEVGHFIAEEGNNFWGVEVHEIDGEQYILASDRDSGLWIFQYTPEEPEEPECTIRGTSGNDVLFGTRGNDVICGGAGNDLLFGFAGDDILLGESGNDVMVGYQGDDTLHGGDGDDVIYGGRGHDHIFGDAGDDRILGGPGDDVIVGGGGDDIVFSNMP